MPEKPYARLLVSIGGTITIDVIEENPRYPRVVNTIDDAAAYILDLTLEGVIVDEASHALEDLLQVRMSPHKMSERWAPRDGREIS